MRVSAWAIRHPLPVAILFVLLALAGFAGFTQLPVKHIPDVSFPTVQVTLTLPGAAPAAIEAQVTRPVEAATAAIAGIAHVQSTVSTGRSVTTVTFDIGEDPDRATSEVRAAVDAIRDQLPADAGQPVVARQEFETKPVVAYAIAGDGMTPVALGRFVDDVVTRRLTTVAGVAQVTRLGGVSRQVNVTLDPDRLAARGLTAVAVNDALRRAHVDAPGGTAGIGGRSQTVRVLGTAASIKALATLVIPTGDGRTVTLGDVATVTAGAAEQDRFALLDGRPVIAFQVMKTRAASDMAVEVAVDATVAQLAGEHRDLRFRKIVSGAQETRASYHATLTALVEGMVLAAIVVFVFLREWRSTVIAALAMPISLAPTFAAMALLGFSLNIITLLGLTLVIGVLVDDAIVEIENIEKRIEAGETPYRASLIGADAIGLAVMATTLAIVVVFLPVSFMPGMAGRFFREFGLTVSIAVLFSLLVARLLTPLLAAYFLRPSPRPRERKPFAGFYRNAVEWTLAHRWMSVLGALALFGGAIALAATLPTGFTPDSDDGIVSIGVEAPPGTPIADVRAGVEQLTALLHRQRDVSLVFASVGAEGDPGSGVVTVVLAPDRERTTQAFQAAIRPLLPTIPDLRLTLGNSREGSGSRVEAILSSEDGAALSRAALALEQQMRRVPHLANVHQLAPRPAAELVIRPRPDAAARAGVTTTGLAAIVRVATRGERDAETAKFDLGDDRLPIRVRLPEAGRTDLDAIGALRVPAIGGRSVPLRAVADLSFEPGVTRIDRIDRARRATVQAELSGISVGQALKAIDALPVMRQLPPGVTRPAVGQSADMAQLFGGFLIAMGAGVAMIYGVLALLFGSVFKPVTILAALPLSLAGAFIGLKLGGAALNLPALIGLLMLMGLAAKNSILLVEHAIESERAGVGQHDALIEACRERARPIVMTTCAMAAGMLPTVLGLGEGSEFRVPMALAVIGGLISSTTLSLVLVPVVYEIVEDFERWLAPRLGRFVGPSDTAADQAQPR